MSIQVYIELFVEIVNDQLRIRHNQTVVFNPWNLASGSSNCLIITRLQVENNYNMKAMTELMPHLWNGLVNGLGLKNLIVYTIKMVPLPEGYSRQIKG